MKNIKAWLLLVAVFSLTFSPAGQYTLQASPTNAALSPGRVYEFYNSDSRTISYVTVGAGVRYDYVSFDRHGHVIEFGTTGGRCPVRGGGITRISVPSAASARFDAANIKMTHTEGTALTRLSISEGDTAVLSNLHTERAMVSIDNAARTGHAQYDCVVYNDDATVSFYAWQTRFTSHSIPMLGSAVFTAGEGGLTLLYPAVDTFKSQGVTRSALMTHALATGQARTLTNSGTTALEVTFSAGAAFVYDYALRDAKGYVVAQASNERGGQLTLPAGHSLALVPKTAATLFYPGDWHNQLTVAASQAGAPGIHELSPGHTLTVASQSLDTAYDIRIANQQAYREFSYDFILQDLHDVRYGKERREGAITLPPGATLSLTAGPTETLEVRLPATDDLTVSVSSAQAVDSYVLASGASVVLSNQSENEYSIATQSPASAGQMHFVCKDDEGETVDFGRIPFGQAMTVEPQHTWLLFNAGPHPVELVYPFLWLDEGLSLEASDEPALSLRLIPENQTMHVTNTNRLYDQKIKAEGENTPAAFDYVLTDPRGSVTEYGVHNGGELYIPAGGRLAIMPQRGSTLALYYPDEQDESVFKQAESSSPPLHRAVYKPNSRFTLHNRTRDRNAVTFHVQNNSTTTHAAYFVREGRDNTRIAANEPPTSGVIIVPENTSLTITVAVGGDLHIWIPLEWAKQLIR